MFWVGFLIGIIIGKPSNDSQISSNSPVNYFGSQNIQGTQTQQNFNAQMAAQQNAFIPLLEKGGKK